MNQVVNSSSVNEIKPAVYELTYWQQWVRTLHLPTYVWVSMILLAATAICYSLNLHTQARFHSAKVEHQQMIDDIKRIELENARLQKELEEVEHDPRTIETLARQAGMVANGESVILMQHYGVSAAKVRE